MKYATAAFGAALFSSSSVVAFHPHVGVQHSLQTAHSLEPLFSTATESDAAPVCAIPDGVVPESVTAKALRSATLTNADGQLVTLGDTMGSQTSIVVFLRHLGWPYCWTYANDWCKLQQEQMLGAGVEGPIFVSIGNADKLNVFLDQNPDIPRDQAFVDDYSFDAYKAAGFGRFDDTDKDAAKEAMGNMQAPDLGFQGWWNYLSNVMKVSPIPDDMKFGEVPEGVLRLGGTFVVSGDKILYRWSDRVPGDHPDIDKVWTIAKEASEDTKNKGGGIFQNIFGL